MTRNYPQPTKKGASTRRLDEFSPSVLSHATRQESAPIRPLFPISEGTA